MTELNENNKKDYIHRPFFIQLDKISEIFFQIIWKLLLLLFSCCLFLFLYCAMDFIFPPVPYVIHNCLIGLVIGCVISYGLQENKYASKKILFIIILLCSVSAYLRYSFTYTLINMNVDSYEILFHRLTSKLYLCLICLGIGGFISYRKNRYINVFFIGKILLIYSVIFIMYKPTGEGHTLYNMESGIRLQQLYLLFFFFLSLVIIEAISYEVKKKGYPNKKKVFIWILLCSFITYLSLSVIYYILAPEEFASSYWNFLWIQIKYNIRPQIGYYDDPWGGGMWEGMPIGFKIFGYFINFCKTLTFNKISYDNLVIIVTILLCFTEFLITSLCAWMYITYTYFSPSSSKLAQGQKD